MRIPTCILLGLLLLLAIPVRAEGDLVAGEALYATCVACHGAGGEGNSALNAPALAHLDAGYIARQLRGFRAGLRGGEQDTAPAQQMRGIATTLSDVAVTDVAAYTATLAGSAPAVTLEGDRTMGADYYNQFCGACHGPAAEGNPALNSPALAGANDWYLLAQLNAFRDGVRGSHPDDRTGRQMRAMAAVMPDEQALRDVVAFIAGLGR
jgi:cytochrome c oxidase subunit 2